jgi:hypothetical protein
MLPLYPGSLQGGSLLDKQLSSLFGLEPDGSPTSEFLQAVQSKDFWWDSLFLLDRLSLARLVELAGGVELDGEKMDGEQAVAWLPSARETPQAALVAQAALAHELCEKSPLIFSGDGMVKNLESVFGQTYLTPGLADGIAGWRLPEPASRLFCELPTFRGTSSQEIAQSK